VLQPAQWVEEVEAMDGYLSLVIGRSNLLAIISPLLILCVVAINWLCAVLLLISGPFILYL